MLGIDRDLFTAGQIMHIDPVTLAIEEELDAFMGMPFPHQTLADARRLHEVNRTLLKYAGSDRLLDFFAAAIFNDDRFDSLKMQQVGEHESGWPRS